MTMREVQRKEWFGFNTEDIFMCPYCLSVFSWQFDEWHEETEISCYSCERDIKVAGQTHYWYTQDDRDFAEKFLRARGYEGTPLSWYAVTCYLEHFLEGNKQMVEVWKDTQWQQAFEIVSGYFDRKLVVIPKYEPAWHMLKKMET